MVELLPLFENIYNFCVMHDQTVLHLFFLFTYVDLHYFSYSPILGGWFSCDHGAISSPNGSAFAGVLVHHTAAAYRCISHVNCG